MFRHDRSCGAYMSGPGIDHENALIIGSPTNHRITATSIPMAHDTFAATNALMRARPFQITKPWWLSCLLAGSLLSVLSVLAVVQGSSAARTPAWWVLAAAAHTAYLAILLFLFGGLVERIGFYWRGRAPERPGMLPARYPTVCVQLPMFNEHAVAHRVIHAAATMRWPRDRLTVQVLDDSTDTDTRALVAAVCGSVRESAGVECQLRHRTDRSGFKAGALEEGRHHTDAEFLAIFDSDFVPPQNFLLRTLPHFYDADGAADTELALVQTQWGHLNDAESALTLAQALWVDDHHTLQMSWRSARWGFVNFTGTAGVWRASAITRAGGWRAASLVEDCELSFRHLFAGYRTKFVKEIVVPAELPATYTAYKAQQKRWTQGWVQLQRLHLRRLLFEYSTSAARRCHLAYHMCISWQWPAWALWTATLPIVIFTGGWLGSANGVAAVALYLAPPLVWTLTAGVLASAETRHTDGGRVTPATILWRLRRVVPYFVLNAGMLPHQFAAFVEGLFGGMHSEFERTPKAGGARGSATAPRKSYRVRIHWPYILTEAFFVVYQLSWSVVFVLHGLTGCAVGAAFLAACVGYVAFFYGDYEGKVCFVVNRPRLPRWRRSG